MITEVIWRTLGRTDPEIGETLVSLGYFRIKGESEGQHHVVSRTGVLERLADDRELAPEEREIIAYHVAVAVGRLEQKAMELEELERKVREEFDAARARGCL